MNGARKKSSPATKSPGAEAWQLMWQLFKASKPYLEALAGEFELSPQQLFALRQLGGRAMAMSDMASLLGCDASNVTALVDKLESRGLVERHSSDQDRRVKALVVTEIGRKLQRRIGTRLERPPPAIGNLSLEDQRALRDVLRKALAPEH